jgi:AraC-like DNA-binding protein
MYKPVKDGIDRTVESVTYTEAEPPEDLKDLVHCFWEVKSVSRLAEDFEYHILPDACVNVMFNQLDIRIAAVTALDTSAKGLNLGKHFHYVGVQLLPGVWRGNPSEIQSGFVDQPYSGELPLRQVNAELRDLDFSNKRDVLTVFVKGLVQSLVIEPNEITGKILSNIQSVFSVEDMAKLVKMSTRQLQRTLKKTTGFSPHDFLKILRIQHSLKEGLGEHYADQSHFIHSFRKITGYTPNRYTKKYDV